MNKKTCLAITGVGGRSVGHQILQSILLHSDKYDVVATDADPFSYGLYQVEKRYVVPRAHDTGYLTSILSLIKKESVQALLPGTEAELNVLTEFRAEIESNGCKLIIGPTDVLKICKNKWLLYRWLCENNFDTPLTVTADCWKTLIAEKNFPIVGKPTEGSGGSRHVALLKDESEISQYLEATKGTEIIFQEYVGHATDEYTVGIMINKNGHVIDSIVVHRNLTGLSLGTERLIEGKQFTLSTGYSQGYIIRHPLIQEVCEKLVVALGMRGPANIQCRLEGDHVKIFEVHPRFSGTTSIRALAGFNEPDVLVRNFLFDENFERLSYQDNVAAIRAFNNILVPLSDIDTTPHI